MDSQRETEARVLAWCRTRRATTGMRSREASPLCVVVELGSWLDGPIVAPDGTPRRDVLAFGDTWGAVEEALASVPADPPIAPVPLMGLYTKLRTGAWGVRVLQGAPIVGASIKVTKRSGEIKTETISRLIGDGSTVEIEATEREPRSSRGRVIVTRFNSGAEVYRNARGRCEDAPCCGCCS